MFNTTLARPPAGGVGGGPLDVFGAGDDEGVKATVSELVAPRGRAPWSRER